MVRKRSIAHCDTNSHTCWRMRARAGAAFSRMALNGVQPVAISGSPGKHAAIRSPSPPGLGRGGYYIDVGAADATFRGSAGSNVGLLVSPAVEHTTAAAMMPVSCFDLLSERIRVFLREPPPN